MKYQPIAPEQFLDRENPTDYLVSPGCISFAYSGFLFNFSFLSTDPENTQSCSTKSTVCVPSLDSGKGNAKRTSPKITCRPSIKTDTVHQTHFSGINSTATMCFIQQQPGKNIKNSTI